MNFPFNNLSAKLPVLPAHQQQPICFDKKQPEKPAPKICVIEFDPSPCFDIDGDGIKDLSHGEVIRRVILSFLPKADVVIKLITDFSSVFEEQMLKREDQLQKTLGWVHNQPFDYVNLSISNENTYEQIETTPLNIQNTVSGGLEYFSRKDIPDNQQIIGKVLQEIGNIVKKGKKIFISAPNNHTTFNLYQFVPGTMNIGGINNQRQPLKGLSSNTLLNCYSQAVFNISKVEGGYDITGDGKVDVSNKEVSGGGNAHAFVDNFKGKKLEDIIPKSYELPFISIAITTGKNIDKIDAFKNNIFSVSQLIELNILKPEQRLQVEQFGTHAGINQYGELITGFSTDSEGTVVYDPDGSGRNAVSCIDGNSIATPVALVQSAGGQLEYKK